MACDQCSTTQKILYGIAGVLGLVGVILGVVAVTAGSEGLKVDFEAENKASFSLKVTKEHCGFSLYTKAVGNSCDSVFQGTEVKWQGNEISNFQKDCDMFREEWAKTYDPELIHVGHWTHSKDLAGPGGAGDYSVVQTSNVPLWAVDFCGQVGEAVSGIFAMLGLFVVAIVVFIVSCIFCCVAACCCQPKPAPGANVVIGAPTTVGNSQG